MKDVVKSVSSAKKKRRGNYSMYYGVIALIVIVTFGVLSTTVLFKIDTMVINGSSNYTEDEIIAACGIKGGDNLIRTNMSKCAENVESSLVYIEHAEFIRSFPSTVTVNIIPSVETTNVVTIKGCYVLSQNGKVLDITDTPLPDIVTIEGAIPSADTLIGKEFACEDETHTEVLYQLIEVADSALGSKIKAFDMSDYLNISSNYDDRIKIEFGAASEFDYKLKLVNEIITDRIGPNTEGTLKILSDGASFIDKEGLEQNEQIYENNIATLNQTEIPEETSESDTSNTNSDTSQVVHFE